MTEAWKAIDGYEGYEVSSLGRVRSLKFGKEKFLKPGNNGWGYLVVNLCKDGKVKRMKVHRLVASAFIPNPLNLETVNHKDKNRTNNNAGNLEWMTRTDNLAYSQPQLAERQIRMLDKQTGELLATFKSTKEAERVTGINVGGICWACKGRYKSAGGFVWRYA